MRITCIENNHEGISGFRDAEVPVAPAGEIGALSRLFPVTGVIFRETPGDYDFDWHPAPRRQFIVLLDGEIEITVGSGETRRFRGGEILYVADTGGRGHRTRSVDGKPRRSLFLPLPEDWEIFPNAP